MTVLTDVPLRSRSSASSVEKSQQQQEQQQQQQHQQEQPPQQTEDSGSGNNGNNGNSKAFARLVGLDMMRGLTMVVMLVVDYTGAAFPSIDHAPWDGVHLADFVMPWFLWVSGFSMSISLRVHSGRRTFSVFRASLSRALRLFLLGLLLQGGWLTMSTEGLQALNLDLSTVRWMGILQRIALAFAIVAALELYMPQVVTTTDPTPAPMMRERGSEEPMLPTSLRQSPAVQPLSGFRLVWVNAPAWSAILVIVCVGIGLTYGVTPPGGWPGCAATVFPCEANFSGGGQCGPEPHFVDRLDRMGCSGPGYIDSTILGIRHVYHKGSNMPTWPPTFGFDPEGLVTTLSATFSMYFGLHAGKVWQTTKNVKISMLHWFSLGFGMMLVGFILTAWVPFNKRLWSPSYSLFMAGNATLCYASLFWLVDATQSQPICLRSVSAWLRTLFIPLQWLGANCILFFVFSDCSGVLSFLLSSINWGHPYTENNIVAWFQNDVLMRWLDLGASCGTTYARCGPALMVFVWVEIVAWMSIAGILYRKKIFWKI